MKKIYLMVVLSLLLSACVSSTAIIQTSIAGTISSFTGVPTNAPISTSIPTRRSMATHPPTYTQRPTPGITPQPTFTPSMTHKPTETSIPTDTQDPTLRAQTQAAAVLFGEHRPGYYLVGIDIGPGIWRSQGTSDDCYWKRMDCTGDIINNYYGFAGSTIYIDPTDFAVELDKECGNWVYLSPP